VRLSGCIYRSICPSFEVPEWDDEEEAGDEGDDVDEEGMGAEEAEGESEGEGEGEEEEESRESGKGGSGVAKQACGSRSPASGYSGFGIGGE
jgi:hypothetical protein